jgi:NADP-dependent 3-hydroxy acid dehydrogenase YdfG
MKEKMKIAITGHTSGLGLSIYNHFNQKPECAVRGISRATGFDLTTDADEVIQLIKSNNFDYFFNNAYVDGVQSKLLRELSEHTCVISSGSMAADAAQVKHEPYYVNKFDLECTHRSIKRNNKLTMLFATNPFRSLGYNSNSA